MKKLIEIFLKIFDQKMKIFIFSEIEILNKKSKIKKTREMRKFPEIKILHFYFSKWSNFLGKQYFPKYIFEFAGGCGVINDHTSSHTLHFCCVTEVITRQTVSQYTKYLSQYRQNPMKINDFHWFSLIFYSYQRKAISHFRKKSSVKSRMTPIRVARPPPRHPHWAAGGGQGGGGAREWSL